jgi:hypothetical protein
MLMRGAGRMLITGAGVATATNEQVQAGDRHRSWSHRPLWPYPNGRAGRRAHRIPPGRSPGPRGVRIARAKCSLGRNADVIESGLRGIALMRSISGVTCRIRRPRPLARTKHAREVGFAKNRRPPADRRIAMLLFLIHEGPRHMRGRPPSLIQNNSGLPERLARPSMAGLCREPSPLPNGSPLDVMTIGIEVMARLAASGASVPAATMTSTPAPWQS